jgi:hypothetical protein
MTFKFVRRGLAALLCCASATVALAQDVVPSPPVPVEAVDPKAGSLYLQCDGNPNNMSAGESVARFVGAVTLLALFAPPVESPDPSKRKFGEAGVAACTGLIDGEKAEGKTIRRLPLILGRALHRIEAKDYKGALADVARAREEAAAAKLAEDPYFDRSMGVSFDMIEAEALLRDGDVARARAVSLRRVASHPYSYYALVGADDFRAFARPLDPMGLTRFKALARISPNALSAAAAHMEEEGRFEEAARLRDSVDLLSNSFDQENRGLFPKASAALTHALAGDWPGAEERAKQARADLASRAASGKPESNAPAIVELLDLYDVVRLVHDGKLAPARRNFAARSQWLSPSFGQVTAVNAMLRAGAQPDELFGALAKSPDQMWTERRDQSLAALLEADKNNKRLWARILPYASATAYESQSKAVWNGDKSRMVGKTLNKTLNAYPIYVGQAGPLTQVDAMVLHSAVTAKARGFPGFFMMMMPQNPAIGWVRFGKPGDPGITSDLYLDADAVIAELRTVIPTPEEVAARKAIRERAATGKR